MIDSADSLRSARVAGALLGVHAGDALGATHEFQSWLQIRDRYPDDLSEISAADRSTGPPGIHEVHVIVRIMAMTWYTADLHFGHANIIRYCDRPWSTPDEMDAGLVANWNAVVAPDDTVWVLGDVALRRDALAPVAALNGRKILVAGNHDSCWTGHRRRERARRSVAIYRDAGFDDVHETGVVRDHTIAGRRVVLSHLPYAGDHTDTDRYADRRPADDGLPLLCGHVHTTWRTLGRQINVGVDIWDYSPVAESTLATIVAELPKIPAET